MICELKLGKKAVDKRVYTACYDTHCLSFIQLSCNKWFKDDNETNATHLFVTNLQNVAKELWKKKKYLSLSGPTILASSMKHEFETLSKLLHARKKKNLAINLKRNKLPSSINIFERSKEPTNHHPQFLLATP